MERPRSVGQIAAIAGRSAPGSGFRQNFAIAINAPVLPADTTQEASPSWTASMARRMLEFRPDLIAVEGRSLLPILSSVWRTVVTADSAGCLASKGRRLASSPHMRKWTSGMRSRASAAPATTMSGAWSPPMASSAMTTRSDTIDFAPLARSCGGG